MLRKSTVQASVHPSLAGGPLGREALNGLPQELAFSHPEYERRLGLARERMDAEGMGLLLVFHPPHVFYLSGYQSFSVYNGECVVLPLDGDPLLVVDPPELGGALMHTWLDLAYGYDREVDGAAFLATLLANTGLDEGRIGIETASRALPVQFYDRLKEGLPRAELVDGSDIVTQVKARKFPEEIEYLRRAAAITDLGMKAALDAVEAGTTDSDVARAAHDAMIGAGSEYMCVQPIVTTGRRSGILHSTHKRVRLENGDAVLIEMGGCVNRYTAPVMRAATVGEPPGEVERVANACLAALERVLATIRPGVTGHDVAEAGWEALREAGDDIVFHGNFGYSIGAGFPPTWADGAAAITLGSHAPLEPGMVFHHPVAVRKLGRFGVAFSETTVVTDDGCDVLTDVERKLFVK